jgi:hypothetical protein
VFTLHTCAALALILGMLADVFSNVSKRAIDFQVNMAATHVALGLAGSVGSAGLTKTERANPGRTNHLLTLDLSFPLPLFFHLFFSLFLYIFIHSFIPFIILPFLLSLSSLIFQLFIFSFLIYIVACLLKARIVNPADSRC